MFTLGHKIQQIIKVGCIPAQHPARYLPVKNHAGDIAVIGRNLAPARAAIFGGYPDKADILITECLDGFQFHLHASPLGLTPDDAGGLLPDHDCRCIGVPCQNGRKDRGIRNAQPVDAVHG